MVIEKLYKAEREREERSTCSVGAQRLAQGCCAPHVIDVQDILYDPLCAGS